MYERTYGYKYAETFGGEGADRQRYLGAAEIAKLMRADIKEAVGEGLLPARWKYSVTVDNFSGGRSVDIRVKDCADAWIPCPGYQIGTRRDLPGGGYTATGCRDVWCKAAGRPEYAHAAHEHDVLTDEAEAAKVTLKRIHFAYNHDGSEIQADYHDVNYYGQVEFQDARSAAFEAEEKARLAAKRAARESGEVVGKVAVYKRDGARVTHLLVRDATGTTVLACGAGPRRSTLVGKVDADAEVTCSRCARRAL